MVCPWFCYSFMMFFVWFATFFYGFPVVFLWRSFGVLDSISVMIKDLACPGMRILCPSLGNQAGPVHRRSSGWRPGKGILPILAGQLAGSVASWMSWDASMSFRLRKLRGIARSPSRMIFWSWNRSNVVDIAEWLDPMRLNHSPKSDTCSGAPVMAMIRGVGPASVKSTHTKESSVLSACSESSRR